ncbi:ABC transporter permease [Oryzifoliimicrobium ureilyticus]|uniref:ABC transporter permease n=1 Tax=Oryzifoliimicrobium ureilyticus TaxID=3113724 RepID=UPI00307622A7
MRAKPIFAAALKDQAERKIRIARPDKLGGLLAAIGLIAIVFMPFLSVKPNRIAAGKALWLFDLVGEPVIVCLAAFLLAAAIVGLFSRHPLLRLIISAGALITLIVGLGLVSASHAPQSSAGRVSPGSGFWLLLAVLCLLASDALVKLQLKPWQRLASVIVCIVFILSCFASGLLDNLSIMKEFATRAPQFWKEGLTHIILSFGALIVSIVIGFPLGLAAYRRAAVRAALLRILGLIQTIPSLALFGLLMLPLGYIAAHVPGAAAMGIRGIGAAPALIALVLYSLLPIVANTIVGLNSVDLAVRDAALGMGMSTRQVMVRVEIPLALPVILTGIRIVLVQTIGLVTVAALIGGGGFGTFIFQGLGQTAMDLVLLGAIPTIALAFTSAIFLDGIIDMMKERPS